MKHNPSDNEKPELQDRQDNNPVQSLQPREHSRHFSSDVPFCHRKVPFWQGFADWQIAECDNKVNRINFIRYFLLSLFAILQPFPLFS